MSIKNAKPTSKSRFKQGYFNPSNDPGKYIGDITNIIYRSSWELRWMNYCDSNPKVVRWSSESIEIPYYHPIKEKVYNYYVDFYVELLQEDGEIQKNLIEVKPKSQIPEEYGGKKPLLEGERITLKKMKSYNYQLKTYIVNKVKFDSAKKYAESRGWKFAIVTEEDLFNTWKGPKQTGKNT